MTKGDAVAKLRAMPVGVLMQHLATISVVLAAVWFYAGNYIEAQADDALIKMLTKQGMSPQDFKDMKIRLEHVDKQLDRMEEKTQDIDQSVELVNRNLIIMREQLDAGQKDNARTYDLLRTMLPSMRSGLENR